jgi:CRISPR-associated protein Csb1
MSVEHSTGPIPLTSKLLDQWATDSSGAVALHVKQKLLPVEAIENDEGIVFPPTYADIGYNIDPLSDGTRVATIDSIGSQANRMEPLFSEGGPLASLVPQIRIKINKDTTVSIFDLPHRAADATVQSSPKLAELSAEAFRALKQGNAAPLCALAPTSLVFGVWDSCGGTGEKRPRLVRSLIRAWDVEVLHAAAQFSSVWKRLDETQQKTLEEEAKKQSVKLSVKGLADAPSTFRKFKTKEIRLYRDGAPNPDARVLGGVLVKGRIEREITVNLLALRGLHGDSKVKDETDNVRRYLLGLALLAALQDMDMFLREGCLLRYASNNDNWYALPRRGDPVPIALANAHETVKAYTQEALKHFKDKWPAGLEYEFNIAEAKKLLAKKTEEEEAGEPES